MLTDGKNAFRALLTFAEFVNGGDAIQRLASFGKLRPGEYEHEACWESSKDLKFHCVWCGVRLKQLFVSRSWQKAGFQHEPATPGARGLRLERRAALAPTGTAQHSSTVDMLQFHSTRSQTAVRS